MRIVGIDPGYGRLGWAVTVDTNSVIDYGVLETDSSYSLDERMFIIFTELNSIISEYKPDCAVLEKLYFSRNTTTALHVANALGVILLVFRQYALPYDEYSPSQIKRAVTGYGRADKKQVQKMVTTLYKLKEIPQPDDAADALALCACHSFAYGQKFLDKSW
jgi:crossover junction endodeoxyribonuclease RuvC